MHKNSAGQGADKEVQAGEVERCTGDGISQLDGDKAGASFGHSLGAAPGPGRGGGQAPRSEEIISILS